MIHYIYCVENLINGKIYVGKHSTEDLDDGYMGSGKALIAAINKHNIQNFQKHILKMCESSEEALEIEKQLVTEEFVLDENTYNLKEGGCGGGVIGRKESIELRKKRSDIAKIVQNRPEIRKRKRLARLGTKRSTLTRLRQSLSGKLAQNKQDVRDKKSEGQNYRKRAVIQCDLEGRELRRFSSTREAGITIGSNPSHIRLCCKHSHRICRNFRWKYEP